MKYIFTIFIFISSSFASNCSDSNDAGLDLINSLNNFQESFAKPVQDTFCDNFVETQIPNQLMTQIKGLVQSQKNIIGTTSDANKLGKALNECSPKKSSKALVLSFAGTGAYNPRSYRLMADLIKCRKFQSVPSWLMPSAYPYILKALKSSNSDSVKWSGLERGVLSRLLTSSSLSKHAQNFDFAIFPSEESEIIANPENITLSSLKQVSEEVARSLSGSPIGIVNAVSCAKQYFKEARDLKINPKLIVLSHSSGGRSAVKFLEKIKLSLPEVKSDLTVTIDPVKEAQHAIQEVASQYAGKAGNRLLQLLPLMKVESDDMPVNVWSRRQGNSLYKTSNSRRWINFYQNSDKNGLEISVKFGIHGSPIKNADSNNYIKELGDKAHGEICYNEKLLNKVEVEILDLFE
jgi:hypothetical protein